MPALPVEVAAEPFRLPLRSGGELRLSVLSLGLACCAVEVSAAAALRAAGAQPVPAGCGPAGGDPDAGPRDVLVIAGTVTDKLAPSVAELHRRLRPAFVVSFGACSNTGGPYWDSYCVTKGVDQLIPVDLYVPGCPPRPEALLDALDRLGAARG